MKQGTVEKFLVEDHRIIGVETNIGVQYLSSAVIVTTGTFLKGLIHIGWSIILRAGQGSSRPSDFRTA